MKTLLITGAEGFTGKQLCTYLTRRGYDVTAGVRNRGRKLAFEREFGKALVCDVSDAINVARVIASVKPDGIIHLASLTRPFTVDQEPLDAYQAIVTAWANVLDATRRIVPRARILLVSACDVYGDGGSAERPSREEDAVAPVNMFGSLKANAESIAQSFFMNYHTNFSIIRPFHIAGAGQSDGFFFSAIANRLANWNANTNGRELQLPDLDFERDLLHVTDLIEAFPYLLEEGKPNGIYNICTSKATKVRDIVQHMIELSGHEIQLTDLASADDEGQVRCFCGDRTKLKDEFEWEPRFTWQQAIKDLYNSYSTTQTPTPA